MDTLGQASDKESKELVLKEVTKEIAVRNFSKTAIKPVGEQASLSYSSVNLRYEFQMWLADGNARTYSPEVVLSCMDRISEYAVSKKISTGSLWEFTNHSALGPIYRKLMGAKLLLVTARHMFKVFTVAGQLYLSFLKEKSFAYSTGIDANANENKRNQLLQLEHSLKNPIDPEDVIIWLVTQPNARGTLYLENVARQYMYALRSSSAKIEIPVIVARRGIFDCHTPDELNAYWEILRAAPNYFQVNRSASRMFSAGLNCYMRYLHYLTGSIQTNERTSESINRQAMSLLQTNAETTLAAAQRVDFSRPGLCAQTKPLTCSINGQTVVPSKQNWTQLLVAITEWFIAGRNPNIESLNHNPLYGSKVFLLPKKTDFGACVELSNGKWIYTNYNPQTIITIIRNLCQHCGIDLDNALITFAPKGVALVPTAQTYSRPAIAAAAALPKPKLDPFVIKQLTNVLSAHFSNGYRLNSPIEMARFRSFSAEVLCEEFTLSDAELKCYIAACGTTYEGKVYVVSAKTKEQIRELAEEYFAGGAKVIFFAEFYAKNENGLFEACVVSEDMLIGILRRLFPKLSFTQTYFGCTDTSVFVALESEILRVWGDDVLLTYTQLTKRLQYIPLERIKYALGQNNDFIWNSFETFTHISRISITDEVQGAIREAAVRECNARGYASITDLPFGEIEERNFELSIVAVHNAGYRICLSDRFDKKGKIITRKGDFFDALTIMKEHCRTIDKCSLDDLLYFEKELTGEVHRWIPMEAANAILVRIDKDAYMANKYVHFNIDLIDEAIMLCVNGDYLPLKSFTTFGAFPGCGQTWNLFLLESYCRRFSRNFRFDSPSVNSRNTGAVIRKSCSLDYTEIMADAVAKANISLRETVVGKYLCESGYTGRTVTVKAVEIIEKAKALRERRI